MRRLAQQIHRVARHKGEAQAEELKTAYAKLIEITEATKAQAEQVRDALKRRADEGVRRLVEQFEHYLPLVGQAISQATRRVIDGEVVPSKEKLLSLFEPHTQVIVRHKAGKPTEFGRKLLPDEVEGGIISRYEILKDGGGQDRPDAGCPPGKVSLKGRPIQTGGRMIGYPSPSAHPNRTEN